MIWKLIVGLMCILVAIGIGGASISDNKTRDLRTDIADCAYLKEHESTLSFEVTAYCEDVARKQLEMLTEEEERRVYWLTERARDASNN